MLSWRPLAVAAVAAVAPEAAQSRWEPHSRAQTTSTQRLCRPPSSSSFAASCCTKRSSPSRCWAFCGTFARSTSSPIRTRSTWHSPDSARTGSPAPLDTCTNPAVLSCLSCSRRPEPAFSSSSRLFCCLSSRSLFRPCPFRLLYPISRRSCSYLFILLLLFIIIVINYLSIFLDRLILESFNPT